MTTEITITTRFRIAAAHSAALIEDNYRGCRVYGMGARPRADVVVSDEAAAAAGLAVGGSMPGDRSGLAAAIQIATGSAYYVGPARNRVTDSATRTDGDALADTRNHAQGTVVHAADSDHAREMRRRGLIGPRGGLTRRGSIAAERLRNAALDDAFGPL